ncbi:MAG: aminotransferase class III-fold pyridoxal phosphate-dependent enzyme, partial [Candidatus Rokuibacteriota bacterium]
KGDFFADARRIGDRLRHRLDDLASRHPLIGDVRGTGAMYAFELSEPGSRRPASGAASAIAAFAAQHGILLLTAGSDSNVIRFLPTLTTTDAQIDIAIDVIDSALTTLE